MINKKDSRFGTIEAIEKIGVSFERLRYWEQRGIVNPKYVKCGTRKYRRYSQEDVNRAILIKKLADDEKYTLEGAIRKLKKEGLKDER